MQDPGDLAARAVAHAARLGAQYADARHQVAVSTELERKERELESAVQGVESGLGVRVLVSGAWGFYAANDAALTNNAWRRGVAQAVKAAKGVAAVMREPVTLAPSAPAKGSAEWTPRRPPADVSLEEKAALLESMDDEARARKEVRSVVATYSDSVLWQRFANTEGAEVTTEVTRVLASAGVTAVARGKRATRKARAGGTGGFEMLAPSRERAREAAESAVRLLTAKRAPGGRLTIIADPELVGVFSHEAVGHACEADLVLAGDSVLRGKLGERLGNELVSIADDPTLPGAYGSFPFDDEGVAARRRVLVERGVLRGYLCDRATAAKLGLEPNGAARAEGYAARPIVRMSNTFMLAGDHSFEELLEGVARGVYARGSRGGQVDTAKGTYTFSAQEAWLVERGEPTTPLRDVGLTGFVLETLRNVDAVGKDLALRDPGMCGKGQYVPVGDGGPHVRMREVVVGGAAG